jgi:lysophospholipase L1-like esterase
LPLKEELEDRIPTIFTLGDSTVKSYTFAEAPMCGWGQVFDNLFDFSKVNVINYSMGGRSFKNSYAEGRFNDILISGKVGDYVIIQFGHNDEQEDENKRFGRGSTEEMYESYIRDIYIPSIRCRGMIPILVTPMSRVNGGAKAGHIYENSFKKRKFPEIMKKVAEELGIMLIDLNAESLKYYNEIGVEATTAIYMSIEAGETPGKTNDGSYANGHPSKKIDGTHYKEALAKQFSRIIITEVFKKAKSGNGIATSLISYLKEAVKEALKTGDWTKVHPEVTNDTSIGRSSYYRNQIEKLLQLEVLSKDKQGNFYPYMNISVEEFIRAISKLMKIDEALFIGYRNGNGDLTREVMGAVLYDAYQVKFTEKPKFMTDYNGKSIVPGDPAYDPNLDSNAKGIMYYPLVSYEQLEDISEVSEKFSYKIKEAYELGLIRSEKGIGRGRLVNGSLFEPKVKVTREKASKTLYYMWVLNHQVNGENDLSVLG